MLKLIVKPDNQIKYLALLLNLLILRTAIPYLEYLFAAFALLSFPMLYVERKNIMSELQRTNKHIKFLASYLAVTLIFLSSFLFTRYYTFILIREFVIAIFFLFYLFFSLILLKSQKQLVQYVDSFKKQFVIITSIAAILGIVKFIFDVLGIQFSFLMLHEIYPIGTSLKVDQNFFSLSILIGFVFVLDMLSVKSKNKLWYNLLLVLYMVNVLFSSSRRGIILLILINLVIFILWVFNKRRHKVLVRNIIIYFLLAPLMGMVLLAGLYFYGNYNKTVSFDFKYKITGIINDYRSIVNKNNNYIATYQLLWKSDYVSDWKKNNEIRKKNGSITNIYGEPVINSKNQTIFNLEQIPEWHGWICLRTEKVQADSFKLLRTEGFHPGASLYRFVEIDTLVPELYVSMNIKVEKWNKFERVELRWNNNKKTKSISDEFNDGKWHNLIFKSLIDSATRVQLLLYFTGESTHDYGGVLLNNLILSVNPIQENPDKTNLNKLDQLSIPERIPIDTKPEVINIDTVSWKTRGDVIMDTIPGSVPITLYTYSESLGGSVYKDIIIPQTQFWDYSAIVGVQHAEKRLRIRVDNLSTHCFNPKGGEFSNTSSYTLPIIWGKFRTYFYANENDTVRISLKLFSDTIPQLVFWKNMTLKSYDSNEKDLIYSDTLKDIDIQSILNQIEKKKLVSTEVTEKASNTFFSPRLLRWNYALKLYKDYSGSEKVFGSGFDYLQKFGKEFLETKGFDYPHNIFLSVLLYSGIMGLLVFLWLIFETFKYYLKSKLYVLFVAYLLILSFVLFSGDSIFELPLLTGFIVIPYIYKIVSLKTNSQQNSG